MAMPNGSRRDHCQAVYNTKAENEVSWFRKARHFQLSFWRRSARPISHKDERVVACCHMQKSQPGPVKRI